MVRSRLISDAEYDRLLNLQGGGCAICGAFPTERSLAVDHDHDTGRIRGLLCMRCNTGIGHFEDSIPLLEAAIDYLEDIPVDASHPERIAEWQQLVGEFS